MRAVTASKILRPIYCSYACFKIMVIKHTEKTNSFTEAWKFCVVEQHVKYHEKKKRLLLEGANSYLHHSGGQMMGISLQFTKKFSILC
jgi:hypothetical protein